MIKVSVMYPHRPGARFDHDYDRDKHMHLVKDRLGPACLFYTVDRGLAGGTPGVPPAGEIMADVPNYTDLAPVLQISEVAVGQP